MHFNLVDAVLERSDDRVVTLKHVTSAEEYLRDHFPGFPVLPGVMMLEAMVQAARLLAPPVGAPFVLARARAVKYGRFVKPGGTLRVEVVRAGEPGSLDFKAEARLIEPGGAGEPPIAASGRLTLRRARVLLPTMAVSHPD